MEADNQAMMDAATKKAVGARLRRIAGQVGAVERMVDADRYCLDLMHQLAAVQAAIGKVGEVVLRSHIQSCVSDAIRSGDERECQRKVEELVECLAATNESASVDRCGSTELNDARTIGRLPGSPR